MSFESCIVRKGSANSPSLFLNLCFLLSGGASPSPTVLTGLCAVLQRALRNRKRQKKKALLVGEPTDRISFNQEEKQGNDDSSGESESRENLCSDEGAFSQEYFVYFKKKGRNQSAKDPGCDEGGRTGVFQTKNEAALDCDTSDVSHSQGLLLSVLGI